MAKGMENQLVDFEKCQEDSAKQEETLNFYSLKSPTTTEDYSNLKEVPFVKGNYTNATAQITKTKNCEMKSLN